METNTTRNDILYVAVVLTDKSKNDLMEFGKRYLENNNEFQPKYFCHHMTMAFRTNLRDDIMEFANEHLGEKFKLMVTHVGLSDKAIAARVLTKVPSTNQLKHVTIATNELSNGKPVDSNNITDWKMDLFLELEGTIEIIKKQVS